VIVVRSATGRVAAALVCRVIVSRTPTSRRKQALVDQILQLRLRTCTARRRNSWEVRAVHQRLVVLGLLDLVLQDSDSQMNPKISPQSFRLLAACVNFCEDSSEEIDSLIDSDIAYDMPFCCQM